MLVIPRLVDRAERAAARWGLRGAQWYPRRSRGALPAASASSSSHCNRVPSSLLAAAAPRGALETLSRPLQGSWEASFGRRLARLAFSSGNRPSGFLEDANLSPRRCKRTAPAPFRPKPHLATLKSASGPLRRRRATQTTPQGIKFNRKFDYQGRHHPKPNTHQISPRRSRSRSRS